MNCRFGPAGPRHQWQPIRRWSMECGLPLRPDPDRSAWTRFPARPLGVCSGRRPSLPGCSETNTAYGVGVNPFAFKWALDRHSHVVSLFRTWRRHALYQHKGARRNIPHQFHDQRRSRSAFPPQQRQHQCGSPLHAHFERGTCNAQSRHQYHSVSFGLRYVQPKRIVSFGTRPDSRLGVSV